ncbi:hypothetical protein [Devosia sp.]|uniref:hypothetical protein n=1 Tax=Devosia sp. TaxID=1871048 RepID=UPI00292F73FA|nr:hypothetical protein [Devosia sp.]
MPKHGKEIGVLPHHKKLKDTSRATVSSGVPTKSELKVPGAAVAVLTAATANFAELSGKYRDKIHLALAGIYAVALFYDEDDDAWQDFCRHSDWEDFKGKPPTVLGTKDKLKPTVRFAAGFEDPSASKTASKYYAALAYAYQVRMPADKIVAYLDEGGGIEKLAARSAEMRRAGTLNLDGEAMMSFSALLDEDSKALLSVAVGEAAKVKLSITKSDGVGQMEVKILQVSSKKPKDRPAKKAA